MSNRAKAVFGIYKDRLETERAVSALKFEGFNTSDISVLLPDIAGSQRFAHEKGTKAPEGAATGAGTGAVIGGTLGLLAGIGALAIPGFGPFIAAGPIMSALAGAGVGGTVGGLGGAMIGFGIPEYEAKRYEGFVKDGGILLSVHVDTQDRVLIAKRILENTGARDIAVSSEVKREDRVTPPFRSSDKNSGKPESKSTYI